MKSPEMKQEAKEENPDLFSTSYGPTLRALIVGAIFIIAVFLLAACGSKAKTAASPTATPTATTAVTASASSSTTGALTCNSDKSSDAIDPGKYFGNILAQVKKEWKADAVISSVRFERQYVKTFQDLCTVKTDSNWQMIFYSLSFADMKKQNGWKFHEYFRPEVYSYESKYVPNFFLGWKMSMNDVVQKLRMYPCIGRTAQKILVIMWSRSLLRPTT